MGSGVTWTKQEYEAYLKRTGQTGTGCTQKPPEPAVPALKVPKMTKTEAEYERTYLRGLGAKFQPFTFHMANGLKYRPDWYIPSEHTFVEVKGGYRLPSHGRSMLAFNQCRVEFPEFKWVLARKGKDGWVIT